jgi:hypothetical protein
MVHHGVLSRKWRHVQPLGQHLRALETRLLLTGRFAVQKNDTTFATVGWHCVGSFRLTHAFQCPLPDRPHAVSPHPLHAGSGLAHQALITQVRILAQSV